MKYLSFLLFFLFALHSLASAQRYELSWSEEFNQEELDEDTWIKWHRTAYNEEHQYYTSRDTNVYLDDGMLHLVGLRENFGGRKWTSGRIESDNRFEFQYGRVEIRAKLPEGKGLWPAFWMLGSDISQIGWPYSGEIDIMEYRGHLPSQTSGTVHFSSVAPPGSGNANADRRYIGSDYDLPSGSFSEEFQLFQFEWTDSMMTWFINDQEFFQLSREEILAQTNYYPFDQPFYFILNLAIGGNFLGDQQPDASTPNRNEVLVDYVRVYQDINKKPVIIATYDSLQAVQTLEAFELEADVTDEDGEVEWVRFYINDERIGIDTEAPYTATWTPKIDGCYPLKIEAYDNDNGISSYSGEVTLVAGSGCEKASFGEEPAQFPGTLQLEWYDYGGLDVSYYDTTPDTNLGNGSGNDFRTTEAVDIIPDENESGNYLISNTEIGEWTKYQLEIEESGLYDIELRTVPGEGSARIDFKLDGKEWIYFNRISSREGENYHIKTISGEQLEEGTHELEMFISIAGGVQPDYLKATLTQSTSTEHPSQAFPASITLAQNYPNPFNPSTEIAFNLSKAESVHLAVYNSIGQHIETLRSGRFHEGSHSVRFNAQNLSSGIYYYQLKTSATVITRKMILMK
ncbi:family 16 glycosylhydrolase [Gracilimonas mengyeensis]|uniref:Por secretion system C-terminal sorting domain-containing protein n=1 Tax=Gracilimonas mengyeensis TaxID=1302730 RepID=A0A521EXF1_9BACT|nr:family 16 glycosylhydrolase [Gracilimonas mengyeensis]SMO88652.1 Por secretion system C-terminal sorting domain-containing protein [Gracilimonas mengyeensis]